MQPSTRHAVHTKRTLHAQPCKQRLGTAAQEHTTKMHTPILLLFPVRQLLLRRRRHLNALLQLDGSPTCCTLAGKTFMTAAVPCPHTLQHHSNRTNPRHSTHACPAQPDHKSAHNSTCCCPPTSAAHACPLLLLRLPLLLLCPPLPVRQPQHLLLLLLPSLLHSPCCCRPHSTAPRHQDCCCGCHRCCSLASAHSSWCPTTTALAAAAAAVTAAAASRCVQSLGPISCLWVACATAPPASSRTSSWYVSCLQQ